MNGSSYQTLGDLTLDFGTRHGLMARGGFQVDIDWEDSKLKQAKIVSKLGNPLKLSYRGEVVELKATEKGKSYVCGEGSSGLFINR